MNERLKSFSELLELFSAYSGLMFSWCFADDSDLVYLRPDQYYRTDPFCLAVKNSSPVHLKACRDCHHREFMKEARLVREPFLAHCPAGVELLAVPLFAKEELQGLLLCGCYRSQERKGYPEWETERARLPAANEKQLLALGRYLERAMREHLGEFSPEEHPPVLLHDSTTNDSRIFRAVLHIKRSRTGKITAAEAAGTAGLSLSRFLFLFRRETGFSFSDYLQRLKVSRALRLVEGSDLPFGEIAGRCGFIDQSRMAVLFRRYFGKTPGEMRKKAEGRTVRKG
ncbi:MAG: HTH-type transcriptional activator Btr [Lentisphaerae bacterium ADurb.Bin242]|nr:MAG: HTH-type transcriptional activator Btr [Lentisphaerae bacterium ADurb.Bin242]